LHHDCAFAEGERVVKPMTSWSRCQSPSTRQALRQRRITFTCPERVDQIARRQAKGAAGGRPPDFDAELYRDRNVIERCFARLKQFRDLPTRYAERLAYWRTELVIATIVLWLR
jgi:transposase